MTPYTFPPHFLWGAATSAHQVEGENRWNDWWHWEQQSLVPHRSGRACDHYGRFETDFDIAARLGHNAHRFSIEWSRIEPTPGVWDQQAIEHYRSVILALRHRQLEPIVTLHHFTLPQWLAQRGGWAHPDTPELFRAYVHTIAAALGEQVQWWVTLNEPIVQLFYGYLEGIWPPGERSMRLATQAQRHMVAAHRMAYEVLHRARSGRVCQVGIAKHIQVLRPCSRAPWDWCVTQVRHAVGSMRPFRRFQRAGLDFLGLNFYGQERIRYRPGRGAAWWIGESCAPEHHPDAAERNMLGWEVRPEGLFEVLTGLRTAGLPILVTENGIPTLDDTQRQRYLARHLQQLALAMHEGIQVLGYLHWSLLDNFEWHLGFAPRFGLVEVDYATQERRVRHSAEWYASVCRSGQLVL